MEGLVVLIIVAFVIWKIVEARRGKSNGVTSSRRPVARPGSRAKPASNRSVIILTRAPEISGRADVLWLGIGERALASRYPIADPLTYVSKGRPRIDDASCIDLNLPVGREVSEPRGALGYWPRYAAISPDQRANYLSWLSSGRTADLHDIGYAFIFFYGLERRLLIESLDYPIVTQEVGRLLMRYPISASFDSYLGQFLTYAAARNGLSEITDPPVDYVTGSIWDRMGTDATAAALAWFHDHQQPLPPTWARYVARTDPRSTRSLVPERVGEQFEALFTQRYRDRYGDGILLKATKAPRAIHYRFASPSLLGDRSPKPAYIQDVLGITRQFAPVVEIWETCVSELKPLSRAVGRGVSTHSRAAYEALPDALRAQTVHPDADMWERRYSETSSQDGLVIVPAGTLAAIQDLTPRPKLTLQQSQALSKTAETVGFALEPDARLSLKPYYWDDPVMMVPSSLVGNDVDTQRYRAAVTILELGMAVAAVDGVIDENEITHITNYLESSFELGPDEFRRLALSQQLLKKHPPSFRALGQRLRAALSVDQRQNLAEFLVGVAAVSGGLDQAEMSSLRSAYRELGLSSELLHSVLQSVGVDDTVAIRRSEAPARPGEVIPVQEIPAAPRVPVNMKTVERILRDSQKVAAVISAAMAASDEPDIDNATTELTATTNEVVEVAKRGAGYEGLDSRYWPLLDVMRTRSSWNEDAFDRLVRDHHLMPQGTLAVINTWSDEFLGDLLIIEGSPILIQLELLEEGR